MDLFKEIVEKREAGQTFVLATIIKTAGSSPRDVGAKMMVYPDGSITGTIGGGTFEKLVIEDCLNLLKTDEQHTLKKYTFSEKGPDATGMYCGGEAEVFLEVSARPERLIIFGGGHIGRELVRFAQGMNFWTTVVDDRKDVVDELSPEVETVLSDAQFGNGLPEVDANSYVVIVTHGHKGDHAILEKLPIQKCAYVGMIGSKAKVARMMKELNESGVDKADLEKIHAPIGLDIGAEGPFEIAVSIMAEIIAAKRKKTRPK
jgi:xanthine dehydrogenase accessory factor